MLKLCGFAASNYYNKVKIALLEKGLAFEEVLAWVGEVDLQASPLGKVPYLITEHGTLCESEVIMNYLEDAYPEHPLMPSDAFGKAKVRELDLFLELHLELVARQLYPQAFFGATLSERTIEKIEAQLTKNIAAFAQLAHFDTPFLAGAQMSLADCAAYVHLPLLSSATKQVYGRDFLADLPVRNYLKRLTEKPYMAQVNADRKANSALMMARRLEAK